MKNPEKKTHQASTEQSLLEQCLVTLKECEVIASDSEDRPSSTPTIKDEPRPRTHRCRSGEEVCEVDEGVGEEGIVTRA